MPDYLQPPAALPPGSVVWAYLRDSGGEGQEQSTAQQRAEVIAYCQRYALALGRVFEDLARTAGTTAGRDAFLEMVDLTNVPEYRPAGLLVWNFARFARDLDDSSYYKATLRKRGLVIHSMTDQIPEGIYGRAVETLIDIANEEKRRQTSRDVKRALQSLFKQGFSFGIPPRGYKRGQEEILGYKRNGEPRKAARWEADPETWDMVKLAWQMRADGRTYGEIRAATGTRIFTGKNCWAHFFSNKAYLGIGVWGDLEIPDHHPAAIDQATWEAVQNIQAYNPRIRAGPNHARRLASKGILSGLAFCVHCGAALNKDQVKTWHFYWCGRKHNHGKQICPARRIKAKALEAATLEAVLDRVLTPEYAAALLDETKSALADLNGLHEEAARLEKNLAAVQKAIQNLLDLAERNGGQEVSDRLAQRQAEKARLVIDLKRIQARRSAASIELSPEALEAILDKWRSELSSAQDANDLQAVKAFLGRFIHRVDAGYNYARIQYTYPLNALAMNAKLTPVGALALFHSSRALEITW